MMREIPRRWQLPLVRTFVAICVGAGAALYDRPLGSPEWLRFSLGVLITWIVSAFVFPPDVD